jgi:hypothetical protein
VKVEDFEKLVRQRQEFCRRVLEAKADEYAPGQDRLSNFKKAAALQGCSPEAALGGLMAKHVIALYDFIDRGEESLHRWDEKITDSINYLHLLEALVLERARDNGTEDK